jgi:formyltetrahydrofolate deformylase
MFVFSAIIHSLLHYYFQDIARISHRDSVADLIQKGRILEKNTLVYAVKAHLEDRIIVYNNKCVVFGD